MVDASVGGKTGVNTRAGKNLVGAFHPPAAVVADPTVLATLHPDHFAAGLVEAVKHGIVADAGYFDWIDRQLESLRNREPAVLTELVARSVRIKAKLVGEDEREAGVRAILNAGHTVGHAVEQVTGYRVPHGDAVAIGLVTEARLAERLGIAPAGLSAPVARLLTRLDRPIALDPDWPTAALIEAMQRDKKTRNGTIRVALPNTLGAMARDGVQWTIPVPVEELQAALVASIG
jgi:3-dehydroquinate synthase